MTETTKFNTNSTQYCKKYLKWHSLKQFVKVCLILPQFATVYHILPQFDTIYHSLIPKTPNVKKMTEMTQFDAKFTPGLPLDPKGSH